MRKFIIFFSIIFSISSFAKINLPQVKSFDLVSNKDKTVTFKQDTKYRVFYFLNSNCPCSQAHFDHLNGLKQKYPKFSFMGFQSNDEVEKEDARAYFDKFNLTFPVFLDQSLEFANIFQAMKTPHVFVLDNKGELVFQGGATNSRNPERATKFYLKDALAALNKGITPSITNAKTIGCYIQR